MPLTLLRRAADDRYAVVEMGMNHRGEISALAEIAEPTIGVLTNVGTAHIEFLGSRENIALEKGDLLAAIPAAGTAVVGRDEPLAFAQAGRTTARVLSFGRHAEADLRASAIRFLDEGAYAFRLETPFGAGEIRVSGLAETIVENALAAAGGAFAAGASFEEVATGLAAHAGVPGRMQPRAFPNDVLVIDDSYNANPQSMRNALETLGPAAVQRSTPRRPGSDGRAPATRPSRRTRSSVVSRASSTSTDSGCWATTRRDRRRRRSRRACLRNASWSAATTPRSRTACGHGSARAIGSW